MCPKCVLERVHYYVCDKNVVKDMLYTESMLLEA